MTHVQDYGHVSPGRRMGVIGGRARPGSGADIARSYIIRVQDLGHVWPGRSVGTRFPGTGWGTSVFKRLTECLYDANLDHAPVVAIVGQQKRMSLGGTYQQEVDLNTLFNDVSEYVQVCMEPAQAATSSTAPCVSPRPSARFLSPYGRRGRLCVPDEALPQRVDRDRRPQRAERPDR